jgi:hypothetical protein
VGAAFSSHHIGAVCKVGAANHHEALDLVQYAYQEEKWWNRAVDHIAEELYSRVMRLRRHIRALAEGPDNL